MGILQRYERIIKTVKATPVFKALSLMPVSQRPLTLFSCLCLRVCSSACFCLIRRRRERWDCLNGTLTLGGVWPHRCFDLGKMKLRHPEALPPCAWRRSKQIPLLIGNHVVATVRPWADQKHFAGDILFHVLPLKWRLNHNLFNIVTKFKIPRADLSRLFIPPSPCSAVSGTGWPFQPCARPRWILTPPVLLKLDCFFSFSFFSHQPR